jgi:Lipase (class 3)
MRQTLFIFFLVFCFRQTANARQLQPGFSGNEFRKLFNLTCHQADTPFTNSKIPYPTGYTLAYRSKVAGLDNRWDLWTGKDSIDVISIRGTTATTESWLANLYASMIPATGILQLDSGKTFKYKLATDTNAFVHIGWMIGLSSMAPEIVIKINEEYKKGVRDFYIVGHSQGGAIGFLLTSFLFYERGKSIPNDIRIKTYSSGVPKPGNIFYGYDFDFITRGGWAFRIVSTVDWVPQVPLTAQTIDDVSKGSPFETVNALHGPARWYAKHMVRKMNRSAKRARKRFSKFLGRRTGKLVRRRLQGFPKQEYAETMNYAACGSPVILQPDAHYYELFKNDGKSVFKHHGYNAYLYLLNLNYPVTVEIIDTQAPIKKGHR